MLEVAGEKSGWGKRKPGNGWGLGIAAHRSFNTYVASVVEVEVDGRGDVRGPARSSRSSTPASIVNPDRVRSQMEGAAVMAVGLALTGEITAANGRIQQSNFNDFQVARMNDAPVQVNVHFVESIVPPGKLAQFQALPALRELTIRGTIRSATTKYLPISVLELVDVVAGLGQ